MATKEKKLKKCFYITPIGDKKSTQYEKLEGLEENVLKPVLEQHDYELEIAHTIDSPGSISDQIFERIVNSELVIVNLTGLNPNVMYELAVRHSFGKPCVMICEVSTKLPFDLLAERTIFYDDTIKGSGELKNELTKKIISSYETGTDNPVTRAVSKAKILEGTGDDPLKIVLSEINLLGRRLEKLEIENTYIPNRAEYFTEDINNAISLNKFTKLYQNLNNELEEDAALREVAKELGISRALASKMFVTAKKRGKI